jgi:pyruvate formate lyase activating enzyme
VLPFHTLGAPKYAALGLDYPCGDVAPPGDEQIAEVRAAFAAAGLRAV